MKVLKLPITPIVARSSSTTTICFALVDTQQAVGNHCAARRTSLADVVVDHHPLREEARHRPLRRRGRRVRRHVHHAHRVPARGAHRARRPSSRPRCTTASRPTPATSSGRPATPTSTATSGCSRASTATCSRRSSTPSCRRGTSGCTTRRSRQARVYSHGGDHRPGRGLLPGHGGRGRRAALVPRGHQVVARLRQLPQPALRLAAGAATGG